MFPYEKLEVYSKAFITHQKIHSFLKNHDSLPVYYRNQFGRASLSIVLNIAEGSGRHTNRDRKNFLVNARGSVFECATLVDMLNAEKEISIEEHLAFKSVYEEISKMLYVMIKNLA